MRAFHWGIFSPYTQNPLTMLLSQYASSGYGISMESRVSHNPPETYLLWWIVFQGGGGGVIQRVDIDEPYTIEKVL